MKVTLETIGGRVLKAFNDVVGVGEACIAGHIFIQTELENFILAIQQGEVLVIDKEELK